MKRFKIIDLWGSAVLIAGFAIFSLARLDYTFLIGYFVVGAWQLFSMLVHFINHWFCEKATKRSNYQKGILIFTGILLLSLVSGGYITMLLLFPLLFCTPALAVYYTYICYHEVFIKMQRPLALLK